MSMTVHTFKCLCLCLPSTPCAQACAFWYPHESLPSPPSSYSRMQDNRQEVIHGKFQLDTGGKNTRKVARHWGRGLKRSDQHPWRYSRSAGQVPQHPDLMRPALSRCWTTVLPRSLPICMALSCRVCPYCPIFHCFHSHPPQPKGCGTYSSSCSPCPSSLSAWGGAAATVQRGQCRSLHSPVLQRFAQCCAGGLGLIAMHEGHRGALFCAA